MQDITPDVVTPDQLVNEILRRQYLEQQQQSSVVVGNNKSHLLGQDPADLHNLCNSEDDSKDALLVEMESRRSSMTKAMSIEEAEDEDNGNVNCDCGGNEEVEGPGCTAFCKDSSSAAELVILDCQNPLDFQECHIRGALNVTFPAIMIRRIAAGKIDIFEMSKLLKAKIANSKLTFIVYDSFHPVNNSCGNLSSSIATTAASSSVINNCINNSTNNSNCLAGTNDDGVTGTGGGGGSSHSCSTSNCSSSELSDLVNLIAKKLAQNGCRVATLKGGLPLFRELYPEWIESLENKRHHPVSSTNTSSSSAESSPDPTRPGEVPLLGLGSLASLKIQDDPDACDSCIGLDLDDSFPVEIVPFLYLGNASISSDLSILERHSIKHILNVTPDLPNVYEDTLRYLQIPISDHWTQSMLNYFVPAIQFIDEGREKKEGVLVHCLAGISRSVTITMAYLMYKMSMSLNEAYDVVRAKKANISPNFHFMGQLLDFERQLHSQFLSPPALGSSPDSGIEFDRWNSN